MTEELKTVFKAVIRDVNYVKNSPLRGRPLQSCVTI